MNQPNLSPSYFVLLKQDQRRIEQYIVLFCVYDDVNSNYTTMKNLLSSSLRYRLVFASVLALVLISCKKEEAPAENSGPILGLVEITTLDQINTEIQSDVSFIFFHASWCSVCQALRPDVIDTATDAELSAVFFGEVEYEDHPDIVDNFDVVGFPTVVIFKNGVEVERLHGGNHTHDSFRTLLLTHL